MVGSQSIMNIVKHYEYVLQRYMLGFSTRQTLLDFIISREKSTFGLLSCCKMFRELSSAKNHGEN